MLHTGFTEVNVKAPLHLGEGKQQTMQLDEEDMREKVEYIFLPIIYSN